MEQKNAHLSLVSRPAEQDGALDPSFSEAVFSWLQRSLDQLESTHYEYLLDDEAYFSLRDYLYAVVREGSSLEEAERAYGHLLAWLSNFLPTQKEVCTLFGSQAHFSLEDYLPTDFQEVLDSTNDARRAQRIKEGANAAAYLLLLNQLPKGMKAVHQAYRSAVRRSIKLITRTVNVEDPSAGQSLSAAEVLQRYDLATNDLLQLLSTPSPEEASSDPLLNQALSEIRAYARRLAPQSLMSQIGHKAAKVALVRL